MSLRVEASHKDERLWAQLHGAGLKFTSNRLTVLDVFPGWCRTGHHH